MIVPKQLQNPDFRFVLLGKWDLWQNVKTKEKRTFAPEEYPEIDPKVWKTKGKAPFETAWQKNGLRYDNPKLKTHPNNFGVIGGCGKLRMIDLDDPSLYSYFKSAVGDTYTVQTGSGGYHIYVYSDYETNHVFIGEKGEVRANNYQVVSAPCRHPNGEFYKIINSAPIKTISSEKFAEIIKPYLRKELAGPATAPTDQASKDTSRSGLEFRKALALFRKGRNRKEVTKELMAYAKFSSGSEEYRNITLDKAEDLVLQEGEDAHKTLTDEKTVQATKEIYLKTKEVLSRYIDSSELNYDLLTIWTLGTYFHNQFETYPLLTLMARKQSGKTRTLKLLSELACGSDGSTSTSITETYLFRHKEGAVFFDEMESVSSKDKTALREIINSVYKKGNKIVRYRESRKEGVKEYVEECFYPYYPLGLANIYGFGDVLTDRSLQLILQRSAKKQTKLIEDFKTNLEIQALKKELTKLNVEIPQGFFTEWNKYVESKTFDVELKEIFMAISKTELTGRSLEIFFPLFVVAKTFNVLDVIIKCAREYMVQLEGDFVDNIDDLLQNYMDSHTYKGFVNLSQLLRDFRNSLEAPEDWQNSKWFGRAIKRLGLIQHKRYVNGRVQIELKNNTTNTTNPIYPTNTTNTTNKEVELVDKVELEGLGDKKQTNEKTGENKGKVSEERKELINFPEINNKPFTKLPEIADDPYLPKKNAKEVGT